MQNNANVMSLLAQKTKTYHIQKRNKVHRVKLAEDNENRLINQRRTINSSALFPHEKGNTSLQSTGNYKILCDRIKTVTRKFHSDGKEFQRNCEVNRNDCVICNKISHIKKHSSNERMFERNLSPNKSLRSVDKTVNCSKDGFLDHESDEIYEPNVEEIRAPICAANDRSGNAPNKSQKSQFKFRLGRRANRTYRKCQNAYQDMEDMMENEPEFRSRRSKSVDSAIAMSFLPAFSITPSAFNHLASPNHIMPKLSQDKRKYFKITTGAKSSKHQCINHRLEHQNAVDSTEGSSDFQCNKNDPNILPTHLNQPTNSHLVKETSNPRLMQFKGHLSKQNSETNKSERSRSLSPPAPATGMHNWMMRSKMMMDRMVHVGQRPLKASEIRAAKENEEKNAKPHDGCNCSCNCSHCNAAKDTICKCKCCTDGSLSQQNTENDSQQRPWLTMLPRNLFLSEHKENKKNCACSCCQEKERHNISEVSVGTVKLSTADKRISTDYAKKDEICQVQQVECPSRCKDCSSCGGIGCRACKDSESSHGSKLIPPKGFPRRKSTQEKHKCRCTHCERDDLSEYIDKNYENYISESIKRSPSRKSKYKEINITDCNQNVRINGKLSHKSSRPSSQDSTEQGEITSDHHLNCCCGECGMNYFEKKFADAALKGLQKYMKEACRQAGKEEEKTNFVQQIENEVPDSAKFVSDNSNNSTSNMIYSSMTENRDSPRRKNCKNEYKKIQDETKFCNETNTNYLEKNLFKNNRCHSPSPPKITFDEDFIPSNNETDTNNDLHFKQSNHFHSLKKIAVDADSNNSDSDQYFERNMWNEFHRARSSSPRKKFSRYNLHNRGIGMPHNNHLNTEYDEEQEILDKKSKKQGLFCEPLYAELLPTSVRVRRWEKWIKEKEKLELIKNRMRGRNVRVTSPKKLSGTILPTRCLSPYRTNGPHRYEYLNDLDAIGSHHQLFSKTKTKEPLVSKEESIALCRKPIHSHKSKDQETDISSLEQSTCDEYISKEENPRDYSFKRDGGGSMSYPDLCEKLRSASPSFPYDVHADDRYFYLSRSMKDVSLNSTGMQETGDKYGSIQSVLNNSSKFPEKGHMLFRNLNQNQKNDLTILSPNSLTNFLNNIKPMFKKQSDLSDILSSSNKQSNGNYKSLTNLQTFDIFNGISSIERNFKGSNFVKKLHSSNDQLNSH